jgi:dolichyl-phosphate-mannose-protein mannosyltransferase
LHCRRSLSVRDHEAIGSEEGSLRRDGPLLWVAALVVLLHLSFAGRYGFFRDELYFIACGDRPAWGYVDQPPLLPLIAAAWDRVVGGSLLGFRVLPAFVAGAVALITGRLTRRWGGDSFASCFAAGAVAIGPVFLFSGHTLTVNTLEPLTWTGLVLALLDQRDRRGKHTWLWLGLIAGVGLLVKYSLALWAVSLAVGLALSRERRLLVTRGVLAAGLLAVVMVLPSLLWQARHGWPFLELLAAGRAGKNVPFELPGFLAEVTLQVHPLLVPLWFIGIASLWRKQRAIALGVLVFFALMVALRAKPYYLAPAFPTLLAAGAAASRTFFARARWRRFAVTLALLCGAAVTTPLVVPVLSVQTLIAYQRALGFKPPPLENKEYGELPQHFADQFGWEEIGAAAARAWQSLDPAEQARAAVFTLNYGEAAAIQRFARVPVISGHNQYWELGPAPADGSVLIVFGSDRATLERFYAEIEQVGTGPSTAFMMPYERARPIWRVRQPKVSLPEMWRLVRHID